MVAALGHVSGGHLNPAVTLGLLLSRRISNSTATLYWMAQLLGSVLAALAIAWIGSQAAVAVGTPQLAESAGIGAGKGLLLGAVATFFLVLVSLLVGPLVGGIVAWLVHDHVLSPHEAAEPVTDSGELDEV